MTAERLREAARVLRDQAKAARDVTGAGDWHGAGLDNSGNYRVRSSGGYVLSDATEEEATYIATVSPTVALTLADWLCATADRIDAGRNPSAGGRRNHGWRGTKQALAVADAILGGVA